MPTDKTISAAVRGGDSTEVLSALQAKLAAMLDECESGRDAAALSRQLADVTEKLDARNPTPAQEPKETMLRVIAGRRADKAGQARAAGA